MAGASTAAVLVFAVSLLKVMVGGEAAGPAAPCDPAGGLNGFPFCDVSLSIDARAADLVGRLTLPEKVQQLVNQAGAVPRLGIPAYQWWSEALHGVSNVGPGSRFGGSVPGATQFPQVIHSAASFNTSLWLLLGQAVSTEARGMYNVGSAGLTFWSPNVNVFRDPRWGRGQETPGEDPTLTSKYAVNYVRGLQTAPDGGDRLKVAACCKHYTAYDLDNWNGVQRYTFDARVTAQDLADTFDPPFQSCVEDAGVASVMCSYNKVNGVPSCADPNLLAGTVRGNWKLNGYIVSDCDSVDVFFRSQRYTATAEAAAAAALNAGLDLNCGSFLAQHTEAAVRMGLVNESRVDDAVLNNVRVLMRLGWFDGAKKLFGNLGAADVCSDEHRQLALEAARQGIVLLKNDDGALPLSPAKIATLAVVGPNANVTDVMIGNYAGVACRYTTPLQGLSSYTKTVYAPGCANVLCADGGLVSGAATAAAGADAVVVLVGGDQTLEAESRDRSSLRLPGKQEDLVNAVIQAARGPVILFIMSGGPFDIDFAKGSDKVAGILWAGYPGQEGGQAIGDAIFGAYSPAGRLPVSWYPEEYTKIPMTNMNMRPDPATGYPGRTHRFYTGRTLYQFGDGLSYTAFNHTLVRAPSLVSLALNGRANRHGQGGACAGAGNGTCRAVRVTHTRCSGLSMDVHVDVHNLGKRDSGHVLLLFSSPPSRGRGRGRGGAPRRHLIGFQRLHVSAGATHRVHFAVDVCRDLSVVDTRGARRLPVGSHILHVGRVKHSFNMQLGN